MRPEAPGVWANIMDFIPKFMPLLRTADSGGGGGWGEESSFLIEDWVVDTPG